MVTLAEEKAEALRAVAVERDKNMVKRQGCVKRKQGKKGVKQGG